MDNVRYDPRDHSHIWVYGENGSLVCKAKFMGLHLSAEQTQETIERRRSVKKRLKREVKEKQTTGEEFIRKDNSDDKPADKKTEPEQQVKRRLRRHFHERD
ncbi:MAG TPA: Mu transposase C-terminal domain-containing protein [Candidatus Melainabacteria bacterium]|nr:Mu transposase C-terminal domain-containing protein [Candidatus Melainabacteria bacterium]HMP51876.1 Mu transposase C-terminal domain-containing protein [Candidatus Melainabacteria bacterium]